MNAILPRNQHASQTTQPQPTFNCVVIYENTTSGECGERFYQKLVEALGGDCIPNHNLWSFAALAIPEMRNLAASAASVADIVIFALSGDEKLPAKVKEWVDMWLWLIESGHPALVPLFDSASSESASIGSYLRSATASKRLACFPHITPSAVPANRLHATAPSLGRYRNE